MNLVNTVSVCLLVAAAGVSGCRRPAPENAPSPATVVRVAPVVTSTEAVPLRVPGILSRVAEAELSFLVGGIVEEIPVRAGDRVKRGDVLARLRLDEIDAQVVQARSNVEKARRDRDRVLRLREGSVATVENAQDAATAVELAEAALRIAEFNRAHAVIVAPAYGRILRRSAEPDELVGAGKTILTFGSDEAGWLVRVALSEADVARIRVGDRADLEGEGGTGARTTGRVRHIAEAADPATRTTEIEIALDAPLPSGRSGYVVAVTLHPAEVPVRAVVPASALIEGMGRRGSLFVVEPGGAKARRLPVEIDETDRDRIYLSTALPPEARVVVSGAEYLYDGAPVEIARD